MKEKDSLRLDKYLASSGIASRSICKQYLKQGRIRVNGEQETKGERKIIPSVDAVTVDGKLVLFENFVYYMMNKPKGVISATEDKREKTVLDLMKTKKTDIFPVGRLDKDTEGLLFLTNDGQLAHQLLSPKKKVPKTYYAKIKGKVTEEDKKRFAEGISFTDFTAMPAVLQILSVEEGQSEIIVTIYEGKFHQVKRMFEAVGKQVIYLKRLSMGSLQLDKSLKLGEYRPLTKKELKQLQKETNGGTT